MALIDDLRELVQVEHAVPVSSKPTVNELADLFGALLLYTEHGEDVINAAKEDGPEGVQKLLAPEETPQGSGQEPAPGAPSSEPAPTPEELQQFYTWKASQDHPTVTVDPAPPSAAPVPPTPAPAPPEPPASPSEPV